MIKDQKRIERLIYIYIYIGSSTSSSSAAASAASATSSSGATTAGNFIGQGLSAAGAAAAIFALL